MILPKLRILATILFVALTGPALAATCGDGAAGFPRWLEEFKADAVRAGISPAVVESTMKGVTYDRKVIGLDRNQKSFKLSFEQFWARRVNNAMIQKGRKFIRENEALLARIERDYGVPGPVLVAIWALETGFGRDAGNLSVIRSLATLAYDCRRTAFFTKELMDALRVIEAGYLKPSEMVGAWAGEVGQTQFLMSRVLCCAVDYDGNGRRDLVRSVPDVLASTAKVLQRDGWRRGQPWGPGTANHEVLRSWNKASVYVQTMARLADELAS